MNADKCYYYVLKSRIIVRINIVKLFEDIPMGTILGKVQFICYYLYFIYFLVRYV